MSSDKYKERSPAVQRVSRCSVRFQVFYLLTSAAVKLACTKAPLYIARGVCTEVLYMRYYAGGAPKPHCTRHGCTSLRELAQKLHCTSLEKLTRKLHCTLLGELASKLHTLEIMHRWRSYRDVHRWRSLHELISHCQACTEAQRWGSLHKLYDSHQWRSLHGSSTWYTALRELYCTKAS